MAHNCSDEDHNDQYYDVVDENLEQLVKKCKSVQPDYRVTRSMSTSATKNKVNLDKLMGKNFLRPFEDNSPPKVPSKNDSVNINNTTNIKDVVKAMGNDLRTDFNRLHNKFDNTYTVLENLAERVEILEERENEHEIKHQEYDNRINEIELKFDEIERKSRLNKAILYSTQLNSESPSLQNETRTFLKDSLQIDTNNIKATRFGKGKNTILLELPSIQMKKELFKAMKTMATNEELVPKPELFINDFLTTYKAEMFKMARTMRKNKRINAVFTIDGNVYIRVNEGDSAKRLKSIQDLEKL